MPAQKRSSNHRHNNEEPSSQHRAPRRKQSSGGGSAVDQLATSSSSTLPQSQHQQQPQQQEQHPNEELQEDQPAVCDDQDPVEETQQDDSEGSGTGPEEFDEIITVLRSELRNNVQCPICLGIIKKTRTVMGCLHRFCRECIDKSMRLGNNECPACRIHCASRRSLRDDQDFDNLIEAIYPDAEKYEEEELMFGEDDKIRNEQIQASIEQISRRQSEALYKKRKSGKEVDDSSQLQIPRACYNSYSRRRKNQKMKVEEFDDNDNDGHENPSSSGNHGTETKHKMRKKRRTGIQPSTGNSDGRSFGNKAIRMSEEMCIALKAVRKSENLTWGRGGTRSSRLSRGNPLSKLIDCLEDVITAETETDVQSTTTSLENGKKLSSEKPIVSSHPGLSINQVLEPKPESPETKVPTEGVEPVLAKSMKTSNQSAVESETSMDVLDSSKIMKTSNESAVKSETSMDVPNSSSPHVTQPDVGLQILHQKENPVEATCPSGNNEHSVGDIHA